MNPALRSQYGSILLHRISRFGNPLCYATPRKARFCIQSSQRCLNCQYQQDQRHQRYFSTLFRHIPISRPHLFHFLFPHTAFRHIQPCCLPGYWVNSSPHLPVAILSRHISISARRICSPFPHKENLRKPPYSKKRRYQTFRIHQHCSVANPFRHMSTLRHRFRNLLFPRKVSLHRRPYCISGYCSHLQSPCCLPASMFRHPPVSISARLQQDWRLPHKSLRHKRPWSERPYSSNFRSRPC